MNKFTWMKAFFSPFKRPKIYLYIGKIALGTPYFLPRKWVKATPKLTHEAVLRHIKSEESFNKLNPIHARKIKSYEEIYKEKSKCSFAIPRKVGFDFVGLGWKTKYDSYRHEWNPIWSFVFFKWQIAIRFIPNHDSHYWESWLYYENDTNKKQSREDRILWCMEQAPQMWSSYDMKTDEKTTTNYYTKILKKKYLKLIKGIYI